MDPRTVRPKRSVRRAAEAAERPVRQVIARHRTRLERERRTRRLVISGAVAVILLALMIPAYGYYREVVRVGDSAALVVDGQTFSLEQYARYVGTRRGILSRQIASIQPIAQPPGTKVGDKPTPEQQAAQLTLQQLQSRQAGLTSSGLGDLVEAKLVNDEGQARGLTASRTEMDEALRWMMSPPASANTNSTGLAAAPVTGVYTGTLTLDSAKSTLAQVLANGKLLPLEQADELLLKPAVIKSKLIAALAGNVATTAEQVHARHILVKTEDEANAARKELDGGADFAAVAAKYSIDPGTKDKGGDLGWFGRGVMIPEFETVAFSIKVGEISPPVKTNFGYHLIQVIERDANRPLEPARLEQAREKGYHDWLTKAEADPTKVTYAPNSSKTDWVKTYVDNAT